MRWNADPVRIKSFWLVAMVVGDPPVVLEGKEKDWEWLGLWLLGGSTEGC